MNAGPPVAAIFLACTVTAAARDAEAAADRQTVTFSRDIAPIVFEHCSSCHRPGESGPFPLLKYEDLRKRARQVAEVTGSGYMPPWLPERGYGKFRGERHLTEQEIGLIRRWVGQGAPEGDPADLPPTPEWTPGWQLGEPDLVVQMAEPYILPPDGVDIFRNFVIPLPVDEPKWVRAVELRPGNPRVVHHGVMRVDSTRSSRLLAEREPEAGFGSMNMGDAVVPDGHSIDWTPGMAPYAGTDGLAWRLKVGTDAVLQLHMLPTGRPEQIQPVIGLHFTDTPPDKKLFGMMLRARDIDIPAGEKAYVREDAYVLPTDVEVLSVYPHAHYLGKDLRGWAELPDGSTVWLVRIEDWDFNWQDVYRYERPVRLPKGSTVHMRFVYDNTADNVRNPNHPPKRVVEGSQSYDEMGTLSFEILVHDDRQLALLEESINRQDLEKNPDDWVAHHNLAIVLHERGELEQAIAHYREVLRINPTRATAIKNLGLALQELGRPDEAIATYRKALQYNPFLASAHAQLGIALQSKGESAAAVDELHRALEIDPHDPDTLYNLGNVLQSAGRLEEAADLYHRALEADPAAAKAYNNLGNILSAQGKMAEAAWHYRKALDLRPDLGDAHANLGNVLLVQGEVDEAISEYRLALDANPDSPDVRYNLQMALELKSEMGR